MAISYSSTSPTAVLGGSSGSVKVRLTNISGAAFNGPVTITLYASTDTSISGDDTVLTTVTLPSVKLKSLGSEI